MADQDDREPSIHFDGEDRLRREDGETVADPVQRDDELVAVAMPRVGKTNARAAVNMRIHGADYSDIAKVLDYASPAQARKVVEETLASSLPDESRESLRRLTGARMEALMKKVAPKTEATVPELDDFGRPIVVDGKMVRRENPEQLTHIKTMADLISRHSRIMGVESLDVSITPTNEQYAATMRLLLKQHNSGGAAEGDPFAESDDYIDAEVVEEIEEGELDDDVQA